MQGRRGRKDGRDGRGGDWAADPASKRARDAGAAPQRTASEATTEPFFLQGASTESAHPALPGSPVAGAADQDATLSGLAPEPAPVEDAQAASTPVAEAEPEAPVTHAHADVAEPSAPSEHGLESPEPAPVADIQAAPTPVAEAPVAPALGSTHHEHGSEAAPAATVPALALVVEAAPASALADAIEPAPQPQVQLLQPAPQLEVGIVAPVVQAPAHSQLGNFVTAGTILAASGAIIAGLPVAPVALVAGGFTAAAATFFGGTVNESAPAVIAAVVPQEPNTPVAGALLHGGGCIDL